MTAGFTLVEVMVALVLLSVTALALCDGLLAAQRMQKESGRWMHAVALAEEALERGRSDVGGGSDVVGAFERSWSASSGSGTRRIEVVVRWSGGEYRLSTVVTP